MKKKEMQIAEIEYIHLQFQGIPIDGTLRTFLGKLKKKGYTLVNQNEHGAGLEGKFANKNVSLGVCVTPTSNIPYVVHVFMKESLWPSAKDLYIKLRNMISQKYGSPADVCEQFLDPYYEGDGYEFSAFEAGKAVYSSIITVPNGKISVNIIRQDELGDGVILSYEDHLNKMIADSEENDITYNDI